MTENLCDILDAIVEDDPASVKRLLKANPDLTTVFVTKAQLFQNKICHWLYVRDTHSTLPLRAIAGNSSPSVQN